MQLETRGWFSICSDSRCYCVLSLTSFSQCGCKTLPRCPYSVPEDVEHQFFAHKVSLRAEKQARGGTSPRAGCRNSLRSVRPCHREAELKLLRVSREAAPSASPRAGSWAEQPSFTAALFTGHAEGCRAFTACCSTVQWQKRSAAAE